MLFKGDGPTDASVYVLLQFIRVYLCSIRMCLRWMAAEASKEGGKALCCALFVQPCTGKWNFFLDTAGVCLTPCSMCGGCFGSDLAQCRSDYCKETGMVYSHLPRTQ